MVFEIHGTDKNGEEDCLTLSGETIEDIQNQAAKEIEKREWTDYWSKEIK